MKKLYLILATILLLASTAYSGGVLDFTADTSPDSGDIVYVINDPTGSPGDRKVTIGDLPKGMSLLYLSDWPAAVSIIELGYLDGVTSAIQTQLDGKAASGDFDPDGLAGDTVDDDLIDAALIADLSATYDPAGSAAAAEAASIPITTITGVGLVGGSAASTPVFVDGTNNCVYGINNDGELGCWNNFTPVLTAAPASDDTYTGTITTIVAGEALTQWNVVYSKNKAGVEGYYKYDSDGADKAEPPRCVAVAAIDVDAAGVCLTEGIVRNDGWGMTTNQDEGKKVYASTTAGGITLTEPATDGVIIGTVREQNVIHFKFSNQQASTGSGAPVKATSPTLVTPNIGAATGTSLMASGRVDGTVGTLTSTAASPTTISVATHGNACYFWNIGNSAANSIFTLPTAAAGLQYCIRNYTGITQVLKFQTSAAGQYIDLDGVLTASGGLIKSAGAAGDSACVIGVDATHWAAYHQMGTWTKD